MRGPCVSYAGQHYRLSAQSLADACETEATLQLFCDQEHADPVTVELKASLVVDRTGAGFKNSDERYLFNLPANASTRTVLELIQQLLPNDVVSEEDLESACVLMGGTSAPGFIHTRFQNWPCSLCSQAMVQHHSFSHRRCPPTNHC